MAITRRSAASDVELLVRAGDDPEAFGAFYDRFEAALLRFFVRATGRRIARGGAWESSRWR